MKDTLENRGYGLLPTPRDERDFPVTKVFGAVDDLSKLPWEYRTSDPVVIKDQGNTDMCSAYALTAVSEDQEGVALDPFYTFGKTKQVQGKPDEWGADLRSACKSATKKHGGFLEAKVDLSFPATQAERDSAAHREKNEQEDYEARKHAKGSFFVVDGPHDTFDNMRSVMWRMRDEERSVFTGCDWEVSWNRAKGGIIKSAKGGESYGHAVKVFGWESEYLLAQLSNGKDIGDGGIFRIARVAVNRAFTYGAFTFSDLPREDAEYEIARKTAPRSRRFLLPFDYWRRVIFA